MFRGFQKSGALIQTLNCRGFVIWTPTQRTSNLQKQLFDSQFAPRWTVRVFIFHVAAVSQWQVKELQDMNSPEVQARIGAYICTCMYAQVYVCVCAHVHVHVNVNVHV